MSSLFDPVTGDVTSGEKEIKQFGERYRGRYHMPLLPGESGTKAGGDYVPYGKMSATNLAGAIVDARELAVWQIERVMMGLALREDLYEKVVFRTLSARLAGVDLEELRQSPAGVELIGMLEDFADHAKTAVGANAAGAKGTNRHDVWEARAKTGVLLGTSKINHDIEALEALLDKHDLERVPGLQERVVRNEELDAAGRFDDVLMSRRTGKLYMADLKGLALDTPLATPDGWTTMGAVSVGDVVYDKDGAPTRVTGKSEVKRIGTYVVRFDDGSEIVCDAEHIWWTGVSRFANCAAQPPTPRPVSEVIATLRNRYSGQAQHVVPNAGALQASDADLPIDPYLFGVWLGDGSRASGVITGQVDIFDHLRASGYPLGKATRDKRRPTTIHHTVIGLSRALRLAGMRGHKSVPDSYLRASPAQRLALLQGLMDTDGTWNKPRRTAVFYSVDKALALQAAELITSLGQRVHVAEVSTRGFGKDVISYHVSFTPIGINPFQLPRKAEQAAASAKSLTVSSRRVIVSIESGPDVPTACISVDSPSSTYLAGERMIPTHNTKRKPFYTWLEAWIQQYVYATAEWMLSEDKTEYVLGPKQFGVDQEVAILLRMPSDGAAPFLSRVDLTLAGQWARLAKAVVEARSEARGVATFGLAEWREGI